MELKGVKGDLYLLDFMRINVSSVKITNTKITFITFVNNKSSQLVVHDNLHCCKSSLVCRGFALGAYTFDLIKYLKHFNLLTRSSER